MQWFCGCSGGGSGSGTGWDGAVDTYADLPLASDHTDDVYLVENGSGIYLINRNPAGLYQSDGSTWNYLGRKKETFYDTNFKLVNASDNSKTMRFD